MSRDLNFPKASEAFKRMNAGVLGVLGMVGMPKTPSEKSPFKKLSGPGKSVGDIAVSQGGACKFVIPGAPMGAPRQSRCDAWKPRPVVLRYRAFKDKARECAPEGMSKEPYGVRVQAYIAMPESWPKKKKITMAGKAHRVKPDWDNVAKGLCDALWEEDSCIASGMVYKSWCWAGEERLEVEVIP